MENTGHVLPEVPKETEIVQREEHRGAMGTPNGERYGGLHQRRGVPGGTGGIREHPATEPIPELRTTGENSPTDSGHDVRGERIALGTGGLEGHLGGI